MIGGVIIGLLFAVEAFFIIGILGYLGKMNVRLEKIEMSEQAYRKERK